MQAANTPYTTGPMPAANTGPLPPYMSGPMPLANTGPLPPHARRMPAARCRVPRRADAAGRHRLGAAPGHERSAAGATVCERPDAADSHRPAAGGGYRSASAVRERPAAGRTRVRTVQAAVPPRDGPHATRARPARCRRPATAVSAPWDAGTQRRPSARRCRGPMTARGRAGGTVPRKHSAGPARGPPPGRCRRPARPCRRRRRRRRMAAHPGWQAAGHDGSRLSRRATVGWPAGDRPELQVPRARPWHARLSRIPRAPYGGDAR